MTQIHAYSVPKDRWQTQRNHGLAQHLLAKVKPGAYRTWLTHTTGQDGNLRPRSPQPSEAYLQTMHAFLRINKHVLTAKTNTSFKPEGDFLHYWKQAINIVGITPIDSQVELHTQATSIYQLILKGFDRVNDAMHDLNTEQRTVLSVMQSLYDPVKGKELSGNFNISLSNLGELSDHAQKIVFGLFFTFTSF
jgi:hypothetical protein